MKNHWNSHLRKKLKVKKDEGNASDSSMSLPKGQGENLQLPQEEATNSNTDDPSFHGDCGAMGPQSKEGPADSALDLLAPSSLIEGLSAYFWFSNDDFYGQVW